MDLETQSKLLAPFDCMTRVPVNKYFRPGSEMLVHVTQVER